MVTVLMGQPDTLGMKDKGQKRSSIKATDGEGFEAIIDLMYSALSKRAAEIRGPTVTAIPASRNAAKPLP